MFSISFRKYRDKEKEKQLVYFDHQNVNSLCFITSTAHASSVFLWSYRNTVLNQSACIFALGYFLKPLKTAKEHFANTTYIKEGVDGQNWGLQYGFLKIC